MVVMRSDQHCHKMGTRIIQIKMFNKVVRKLEEVRYILAIKKYLIFIRALKVKATRLPSKMA